MTVLVNQEGVVTPVTAVKVEPCEITQLKTTERNGYSAIQIGAEKKRLPEGKKTPQPYRHYAEMRFSSDDEIATFQKGSLLDVSAFSLSDPVRVTGVTIGKGFAGAIRRYGFSRGRQSHGGRYTRAIGGTAMSTHPGRVLPGKRMPGHMGARQQTLRNRVICKIDAENGVLFFKGSLPGAANGLLTLRKQTS